MRYWGCSVDRENRFSRRFFFCPKSRPWTLSRFLGENCSTFHFPGKKSRTPLKFPSDFGQFSLYGKRDSLPFFLNFTFSSFFSNLGKKVFSTGQKRETRDAISSSIFSPFCISCHKTLAQKSRQRIMEPGQMKFSNRNEQQWQFKKGRKKLWYANLSLSSSALFHPFKKSPPYMEGGATGSSLERVRNGQMHHFPGLADELFAR